MAEGISWQFVLTYVEEELETETYVFCISVTAFLDWQTRGGKQMDHDFTLG